MLVTLVAQGVRLSPAQVRLSPPQPRCVQGWPRLTWLQDRAVNTRTMLG